MSAPRILITADTVGGVWTYAVELARALAPHDVEIALATMGAPVSAEQHAEIEQLPNVTLFESRYALEWMDDPWLEVDRAGDWLLEIAAGFRPDLVHLNGYAHAALPWNLPVIVVAHSCVFSWWSAVRKEPAPAHFAEYSRRVTAGLAGADRVIAPTRAMLDSLGENYPASFRGSVIANARDPRAFLAREKQPRIFSAGRLWDEAKNIATLDAAAAQVDWPVFVAGDWRHPNGSERPAANLHALGRISAAELIAQLGASAIYALPARYEPFGLSALEAALAGCALVLGDIPSLREIWMDAAVFVPSDDSGALAAALTKLIDDEPLRREFAHRAETRAQQFAPARMAAEYLAAYRGCLIRQEAVAAA